MPDATGTNADHNFTYLTNYTTSANPAYVNSAEYRNKGQIHSARLGLANAGTGAPDATNNWDLDGFLYKMTNGAEFEADTDHTFKVGQVVINDTSSATQNGSIATGGGAFFSKNIIANYDSDNGTAGWFVGDSTYLAKLGTALEAGLFEDGTTTTSIGTGVDAISADGGNISLTNGVFEHASNEGQSVANWFSGGLAYGADIVEIGADELLATDKILVRR
jgi:hypothetical protein